MSGITLGTMRSRAQVNLLEDLSSGYWATTEMNTYINMAQIMAAGDILWKQGSTTMTLKQNKTIYLAPSDMLLPLRLRDTSNVGGTTTNIIPPGMIVELEIEVPSWRTSAAGPPLKHIYRGTDYLQIWPPPSNLYDNKTVTLEYVPVPSTLSADSDVFDGPLQAAEAVIELACVWALGKLDISKAFHRYGLYVQRLEKARADQDRDAIFKSLKWRPAGKFGKMHHSIGFRRLFPSVV